MSLSQCPDKFTKPDPNEVNYIEVYFGTNHPEMVYDHRRSTLQAICIRFRGKPKELIWIPVSVLKKEKDKPVFPTTYFRSIWVEEKFAFRRWPVRKQEDQIYVEERLVAKSKIKAEKAIANTTEPAKGKFSHAMYDDMTETVFLYFEKSIIQNLGCGIHPHTQELEEFCLYLDKDNYAGMVKYFRDHPTLRSI